MKSHQYFDVVVVGDYCLDLIFTGLPSLPILGNEIIARAFCQTLGGACNSVIAMHRLGLNVGWAADFGNDEYSQLVLTKIEDEGIDRSLFIIHQQPLKKITISLSNPNDRAFIAYYDPDPPIPAGLRLLPRIKGKLLYVPGIYTGTGTFSAISLLKRHGIKVCMDGNSNQIHTLKEPKIQRILKNLDLFFLNRKEITQVTEIPDLEKAIFKLSEYTNLLVVKDGKNGAYAYQNKELFHCPAINVKVIDTTGAGDCFNAGFIKAWLSGKPINECLQYGNILGGLSTTAMGGIGRPITMSDVNKYLAKKSKT